jgi:GxxExxY protein
LLVEELVIVEVKALDVLHPVHTAQILTYLRFSERRLGLLLNFNVPLMKNGINRLAL